MILKSIVELYRKRRFMRMDAHQIAEAMRDKFFYLGENEDFIHEISVRSHISLAFMIMSRVHQMSVLLIMMFLASM